MVSGDVGLEDLLERSYLERMGAVGDAAIVDPIRALPGAAKNYVSKILHMNWRTATRTVAPATLALGMTAYVFATGNIDTPAPDGMDPSLAGAAVGATARAPSYALSRIGQLGASEMGGKTASYSWATARVSGLWLPLENGVGAAFSWLTGTPMEIAVATFQKGTAPFKTVSHEEVNDGIDEGRRPVDEYFNRVRYAWTGPKPTVPIPESRAQAESYDTGSHDPLNL